MVIYHVTPVRMSVTKKKKKKTNIRNVSKDMKRLEHLCTACGNVKEYSHMKNSIVVTQKIKRKLLLLLLSHCSHV